MAFIGVKIPTPVAVELSKIKVPGTRVSQEEMHVTLLHLGNNVPIPEVLQATLACYLMAKKWKSFKIGVKRVTSFPAGDDGVPVIARVLCPNLHKLHGELEKSLDAMEIPYSKKFPEFKPHVTLSYSPEDVKDIEIDPIMWMVDELVIWGGDEGEERIAITLPLGESRSSQ
jgi:RNA 2',3'-cyclic 3'-phosphodiesterase